MAFKFFEERASKNRTAWNSMIGDDIADLRDRLDPITWEEYSEMRMNSYERQEILPNLTNDCLGREIEQCLKNCSHIPTRHGRELPVTYDDSIKILARLAAKRLRGRMEDDDEESDAFIDPWSTNEEL